MNHSNFHATFTGVRAFSLCALVVLSCGCSAQSQSESFSAWAGSWFVHLNSPDIGLVRTVFIVETDGDEFAAHTRKGASGDILGMWKSTLARIFTDDFKGGSLMRVTDGVVHSSADSLLLQGIFRSALGNFHFNGHVLGDSLFAKLTNAQGENRGSIRGKREAVSLPLDDYPALIEKAMNVTEDKIFNPERLRTSEWKKFEKKINAVAATSSDDVEMVFAFFYFAGKLPISHYALFRPGPDEGSASEDGEEASYLDLVEHSEETAYLRIKSFAGSAGEVDSLFDLIRTRDYQNLIVDLRNNSGGSVEAGMAFAKSVVDSTLLGGVFLTQKWFSHNTSIPNTSEYDQFPYFSEANYDLILEGIHREKGLVLQVIPHADPYRGKLYILTNRRTASTCEPIVYGLKKSGRAVVIGETTAGAMLNGEMFDLGKGFSLVVPTADYYTADGYRIDQNGVEPNIASKEVDALEFALDLMGETPLHGP